jgi:Putative auto-transporter adhesin, head GIN domain
MRIIPTLVAVSGGIALAGCSVSVNSDTGSAVERAFPVGSFTGIAVAGPYEVGVHTGAAPSVRARGSEDALDRLQVEVEDGKLKISSERHFSLFGWGFWRTHDKVRLNVTVPSLDHAAVAGSGGISIDRVTGAKFEGKVAGSGDLTVAAVDAADIELSIAGSGDVSATGKAKSARYKIAGSGDIRAADLTVEHVEVSIAGSGSVVGKATATAAVKVAGAGDVTITGGAKCTVSKAGVGNVNCT